MKSSACSAYLAALCLLAGPALAEAGDPDQRRRVAQLEIAPHDVTALDKRGRECRHWLGTTISDAASDSSAELALSRLRCGALPTDTEELRRKYAESPRVLEALDVAVGAAP